MPQYKNSFRSPEYFGETIVDEDGEVVGKIRIKPVSVLWKPRNARQFYSVPLDRFTEWIESPEANARRTKS